jgi:hypothetical protein
MAKIISINTSKRIIQKEDTTFEEIKKYEELVRSFPKRESYYTRLMILYRKIKNYKKELAIIEKGIKIFKQMMLPKKAAGKNVLSLSKKINKAFGLIDAKGNNVHIPEPIAKWEKRKEVVLKKLFPK